MRRRALVRNSPYTYLAKKVVETALRENIDPSMTDEWEDLVQNNLPSPRERSVILDQEDSTELVPHIGASASIEDALVSLLIDKISNEAEERLSEELAKEEFEGL